MKTYISGNGTKVTTADRFLNVRFDEIATVVRLTEKVAFLSYQSEYGVSEIKKSISNIQNLVNTKQWERIIN